MAKDFLFIFIGGGAGSCLRFLVSLSWQHIRLHPAYAHICFPWPTFVANILGCFLFGLFYKIAANQEQITLFNMHLPLNHAALLLLTTGLCGGFTTFSTFSYESLMILRSGHYTIFSLYILGTVILGVLAVYLPSLLK